MLRSSFVILFLSLFFFNSYSQESKIFWVAQDQFSGKIQSSSLSGAHVTDLITNLQLPTGIAVDCTSTPKKIYFSETGASRIMRMNFDGSNPEEVVNGITSVREIELDLVNRKVYWAKDSYSDDRIQRADMDSLNSNIEDIWTNSYAMHSLNGIGLDIENNRLFWTQNRYSATDVIKRRTFGVGDTIIGSYRNSKDIDIVGNYLYWIWYGEDQIMRSYKNGSSADTILTNVTGLYLDVDTVSGKIYWGENTYNKISCCNLDGTGRTDLVTGIHNPAGIALYVNPLTVSVDGKADNPITYELSQNYPNPFNSGTTIEFSIPYSEYISLKIFNVLGQEVTTLVSNELSSGKYKYTWDASDFASGVYFYKLEAENYTKMNKMIMIK